MNKINNYDEFVLELLNAGFSMGSGNDEDVFSIASFYTDKINYHTENPNTDPWEWRMRVLDERDDIVYSKIFFKKSGYITKDWYPYFLAARRKYDNLIDEYYDGEISFEAKKIYEIIQKNKRNPIHIIKQVGEFNAKSKSVFQRAMVELQMKMYITMCGREQKISNEGKPYGWSSTSFSTIENFFDEDIIEKSRLIDEKHAVEKITNQIMLLNPNANAKKIKKFIYG